MDVYTASGVPGFEGKQNCWSRSQWDALVNIQGDLCMVKEVSLAVMLVVSHSPPPPAVLEGYNTLWDVLADWGCSWIWENANGW